MQRKVFLETTNKAVSSLRQAPTTSVENYEKVSRSSKLYRISKLVTSLKKDGVITVLLKKIQQQTLFYVKLCDMKCYCKVKMAWN